MRRSSLALVTLSLLLAAGAYAGTISVSCNLLPLSNGHYESHGYLTYTSVFGNPSVEAVNGVQSIINLYGVDSYTCETPCSHTFTSLDAGSPPDCFQAQIDGSANDSTAHAVSGQICLQGPPPPPKDGGGTPTSDGGTTWFDPLVLDLNGDGVRTTGATDRVWFDIDGSGRKEHITWTNPRTMEAFLWLNLFGKRQVDNGSELFGVGTRLPDGSRAKDGFEALRIYDDPAHGGNGDGLIDRHDAVWDRLQLWVDLDHNGTCEPWETWPVHISGIELIELAASVSPVMDASGNGHFLHGTYWRRVGGSLQRFTIDSISFRQ